MISNDDSKSFDFLLREAAEKQLAKNLPKDVTELSSLKLLHELRVHQVELEMQNEALRQTQIELEESRDRYVDLYEFAPVGYLTLSQEGMITEINLTAVKLLGKERKKLLNRSFHTLIARSDQDRWMRHFIAVKKTTRANEKYRA